MWHAVTSDRDLVCKVNENTKEIHILIVNFLKMAIEWNFILHNF
jgi:hypothetical protein